MFEPVKRMHRLLPAVALAAFAPLCIVGPSAIAQQDGPANVAAASENSFGFSLLHAAGNRPGNAFISPLSIGQAMTMLYDGAAGATRDQIGQAMDFGTRGTDEVDREAGALRAGVESADPSVQLSIANALWADNRVTFLPAYRQECESVFGAKATSLDFADPSAASTINSWVATNTAGKITSIVTADSIREAGAVLTDAVYFHGTWTDKFESSRTLDSDFTLGSGQTKQLPLMHQTHLFAAEQNDRFQAVRLPYGNGRVAMIVVLPQPGVSLDSVASGLSASSWSDLLAGMTPAQVELTLPKFHIDYAAGLVGALKSIGIIDAFDRHSANFSPMSQTPMFVGAVEHKTTLDVDEAGTTATAATAITMMPMAAMPAMMPPMVIRVDHPFLCAIQDRGTGALLFVGLIRDPGNAGGE